MKTLTKECTLYSMLFGLVMRFITFVLLNSKSVVGIFSGNHLAALLLQIWERDGPRAKDRQLRQAGVQKRLNRDFFSLGREGKKAPWPD